LQLLNKLTVPVHLLNEFAAKMGLNDLEIGKASRQPDDTLPNPEERLITLIVSVARKIGADHKEVSLKEIRETYEGAYPHIGKGKAPGSLDATLNYHCINMKSRFPDPRDKKRKTYWQEEPFFKRVSRGRYMLLSKDEIVRFRKCLEADHPLVYEDDYDVAELVRCSEDV
jgi:hypothetical protein